ncbi:MAG: GNAT family N-acetyltransferase [Mycobacteriales bacterium]
MAGAALAAVTRFGFGHPEISRLELYVEPWNEASWRAAERAGFAREGLLRSWQRVGDVRRDMFMYSTVRDDQPPAGVSARSTVASSPVSLST